MLHEFILERLPVSDLAPDLATVAADAWLRITDSGPDAGSYPTSVVARSDGEGIIGASIGDDGGSSAYHVTVEFDAPGDCYLVRASATGAHVDGALRWNIPADLVRAPEPTASEPHELSAGLFVALVDVARAYVRTIGGDVGCMLQGLAENLEHVPAGGRDGRTLERTMIDDIFGMLDGSEWDSETMESVAAVFTENGWTIREPGDD